jgi:predicted amidohydrolase
MWQVGLRIKAWDTLLAARAIENMSYVVAVNRIGSDANAYVHGTFAVLDFVSMFCPEEKRDFIVTLDQTN